jgi:hypothetical protein
VARDTLAPPPWHGFLRVVPRRRGSSRSHPLPMVPPRKGFLRGAFLAPSFHLPHFPFFVRLPLLGLMGSGRLFISHRRRSRASYFFFVLTKHLFRPLLLADREPRHYASVICPPGFGKTGQAITNSTSCQGQLDRRVQQVRVGRINFVNQI